MISTSPDWTRRKLKSRSPTAISVSPSRNRRGGPDTNWPISAICAASSVGKAIVRSSGSAIAHSPSLSFPIVSFRDADPHLVQVPQQVGGVLVDAVSARTLQLLLAV